MNRWRRERRSGRREMRRGDIWWTLVAAALVAGCMLVGVVQTDRQAALTLWRSGAAVMAGQPTAGGR